jgi:hypothetical protein
MRRVLFALLFVFAVTACGEGSPATQAPAPHGGPADNTLTVTMSFHRDLSDPIYAEGAIPEIRLRDDQGNLVAVKTTMTGKTIEFGQLRPGTYRLEPAVRPCDANCGYLDGRTDGCRSTLELVDSMEVKVEFEVGAPCRIST